MDNDNNDFGRQTALHPERFMAERSVGNRALQQQMGGQNPSNSRRAGGQAAMTQQSSDISRGTQSLPQKLVQLVGYRDPDAGRETWIRPRHREQQ